ncbi:MAG TPA: ParB/RepB/Spo0J family partition protein [Longimicrobium sp.]|nr:ParB/RepB/Spo0J family partition protein [Longimicrobium sp.]
MSMQKKGRLGKGLGALLGDYAGDPAPQEGEPINKVLTSRITANPFQPRREFTPEQLAELEESIRQNGLLQPLVVRRAQAGAPDGAEWELVAGERRWRAVRRLGWAEVPVVVRELDDRAMLVLAIVENVQRADLSPLEEAAAYRRLMDEFNFTQAEVAESVGRERSTVANLLRLLSLPASVQGLLSRGELTMGHARALLGLEDEREIADLARTAAATGMTVRAVEERVRDRRPPKSSAAATAEAPTAGDAHLRRLESDLQRMFGTQVRIRVQPGQSGRIEIPFFNGDDFQRVTDLLLGPEENR